MRAPIISANHYSARYSWPLTAVVIALVAIMVAVFSPSATLEGWWTDQKFALLPRVAPSTTHGVEVVGITEQTLARSALPMGLWHDTLAETFLALADAKPKLIVLDLELPTRDFAVNRGAMQRLAEALSILRGSGVEMVVGRTVDPDGNVAPVDPLFEAVLGPDRFGLMLWKPDGDSVVRRTPRFAEQGALTLFDAARMSIGLPTAPGLINYRLGEPFKMIEFAAITDPDLERRRKLYARLADKVVVIGMGTAFDDRVPQPRHLLDGDVRKNPPGMLVYAQGLRSALADRMIAHQRWWGFVLLGVVAIASFWFVAGVKSFTVFTFAAVALVLVSTSAMTFFDWQVDFLPAALFLQIALPLVTTRHLVFTLRERNRLRSAYQGYVSPVMQAAIESSDLGEIGATRRLHVGVLFVDIRGFTTESAKAPPERVVARLNRYFSALTEVVHAEGGTVDKFRGDGMMAYFGAPVAVTDPRGAVVRASVGVVDAISALNRELRAEGETEIAVGVGATDGEVVIGKVGSRERFDFTIIGDAANLAAHLQEFTKSARVVGLVERRTVEGAELAPEVRARLRDRGEIDLNKHGRLSVLSIQPDERRG